MKKAVLFMSVSLLFIPKVLSAQVVLNEIMADPARDWSTTDGDSDYNYRDDEWVEIFNAGTQPVDITGWRLRDSASDSSWRYEFTGTIQPGEAWAVFGNDSYAWEDSMGYARTGLSLSNSGETVYLFAADLVTVMDQRTYSDSEADDDRTTGRCPDGTGDWAMFDALNPGAGNGLAPTPGSPNCPTSVDETPWGRLKEMYR